MPKVRPILLIGPFHLSTYRIQELITLNRKLRIAVVGGSACSAVGLRADAKAWPDILQENIGCELIYTSVGGLTLVRSIEYILDLPESDILVLHFGTSIGWPVALAELQDRFGIKFSNEFGLHQSLRNPTAPIQKRLRKFFKQKLKNFLKYLFFLAGQYRPKVSIHEIEDQIDALAAVLNGKARHILWIQHRVLQNSHTFIERYFYKNYYKKVLKLVENSTRTQIISVPISDSFIVSENYLSDWVHLSEAGHYKIYQLVRDELMRLRVL